MINTNDDIENLALDELKNIFDKYVNINQNNEKIFNPEKIVIKYGEIISYIWNIFTYSSPSLKLEYDYDNVKIYFHRCINTYFNNTDILIYYCVSVDNKVIIERYKQNTNKCSIM